MNFKPDPLKHAQGVIFSRNTLKLVTLPCFLTKIQTNSVNYRKPYHKSLLQLLLCHIQRKLQCFFSSKTGKFPIPHSISNNRSHLWYFQRQAFQCLIFISCYLFCFYSFLLIVPLLPQYYINCRCSLYVYFLKSIPQKFVFVNFTKTNIFHFFSFQ